VLQEAFAHLPAAALAKVTAASRELAALGFLDELWEGHSDAAGARRKYGLDDAQPLCGRPRFNRHMAMSCVECRQLTPYVFTLTGARLCEPCERAHPRSYGLATRDQLMHERIGLEELGGDRRDAIFRSLRSCNIGGVVWFLRAHVRAAIEAAADDDDDDETVAADGNDAGAGRLASGGTPVSLPGAPDAEPDGDADDDAEGAGDGGDGVADEWERASAEHSANRRAKNTAAAARRAEAKSAQKEHKKRVKADARAKREGGAAPATQRYHAAAGGNKKKWATARQQRESAAPDAWERQWQQLENQFGEGLAGLSGLALTDDTPA